MDARVIAKIKAILRKLYGAWVVDLTVEQLTAGTEPSEISIPSDVPNSMKNLLRWVSTACTQINDANTGRSANM